MSKLIASLFAVVLATVSLSTSAVAADKRVATAAPQPPQVVQQQEVVLPLGLGQNWTISFFDGVAVGLDGKEKEISFSELVVQIYPMPNDDGAFHYEGKVMNNADSAVKVIVTAAGVEVSAYVPQFTFGTRSPLSWVQLTCQASNTQFDQYFFGQMSATNTMVVGGGYPTEVVQYRSTCDMFRGTGKS